MNGRVAKKLRKYSMREFQRFIRLLRRPPWMPRFIFMYFIKYIINYNLKNKVE